MAATKKGAKKAARKAAKKAAKKGGKKAHGKKCTTENLCKYLKDEFGPWLAWFSDDYEKLRIAVVNVEEKAWGDGNPTLDKRFSTPGGPDDPPVYVKPPIWT